MVKSLPILAERLDLKWKTPSYLLCMCAMLAKLEICKLVQSGCLQNSAKAEHYHTQAIQQHQHQAAGEERSLQIRNKKEKSALVANRGGVLALPKVKVPIQAIRLNKKARIEDHSVGRKKQRRSPGKNWMISVTS